MKRLLIYALPFLLFACDNGKEEIAKKQRQDDSLFCIAQKKIDSLKSAENNKTAQKNPNSAKKSKLAFWKKQATLMAVSLDADKAMLNNAQQVHHGKVSDRSKKEIKEANTLYAQDKLRSREIKDSIKKYQQYCGNL